jgi:hypothetical protein
MRYNHKLRTYPHRLIPAAALLAALFVPLVTASADQDCPPGGCPLPPPPSREVNPAPAHADGSTVDVPEAAGLPPVEITVQVLAPSFVDPAPIGASFETIPVPVRYQEPGDVSCGVQALGMALDALPGPAPTSASLLGLLQDNGMMYDYGTGVEELAFAAHASGYTGSFSFHGASFDQLQAQVAGGSPVVVSLGANGEGQPGHFVTVTGVSPDGEWVSYNDPTLGEQVISASEFQHLWGLQGNSGVAVATEPPPESGVDAGVLSMWVAFTAGLMALVSTTPLGKFRQGIGGRLDAGGGGNYQPVRSSSKSSPPAKEKEKENEKDKPPKKSKSRFDDEIPLTPTPPKSTKPRFDEEPPPPPKPTPVPKPRFDDEPIPAPTYPTYPKARFDEEPPAPRVFPTARFDQEDPDPKPRAQAVATPSERLAMATLEPDGAAKENGSVVYTPSAATQSTPPVSATPSAQNLTAGAEGSGLPLLPDKYLKYLPSLTAYEYDDRIPSVPLGLLQIGIHDAFHAGVLTNPDLRLTPTKYVSSIGDKTVKVGWEASTIEVAFHTPAKEFYAETLGANMSVRQSGSISLKWDGWNTTSRVEYDPVDFTVFGDDDRETPYGSGVHGTYVEQKPLQVAAFSEVAVAVIGAALIAPETLVGLFEGLGKALNPLPDVR